MRGPFFYHTIIQRGKTFLILSVAERILLLNVLPPAAEGPLLFLREVRTFRESLGFSEAEAIELSLRREPAGPEQALWKWNAENSITKDIPMGPVVAKYVSQSIMAAGNLKEEFLDFYARFLEPEA